MVSSFLDCTYVKERHFAKGTILFLSISPLYLCRPVHSLYIVNITPHNIKKKVFIESEQHLDALIIFPKNKRKLNVKLIYKTNKIMKYNENTFKSFKPEWDLKCQTLKTLQAAITEEHLYL